MDNKYLTGMSQPEEIKNAMHNMYENYAPDPDCFGECVFPSILGYSRN